jgi:formylglycine-generating enzyme
VNGMQLLAGGTFLMGSDAHYREEGPVRCVHVDSFWIDLTPVTNAQFAEFVKETGYVTMAERPPDPASYPGILPEMIAAGSLLFTPTDVPVPLTQYTRWWRFALGACWRHPRGPGSGIELEEHPVVHVAYEDAIAYAHWCDKRLPTEAEWEFAARGGIKQAPYAWGNELEPDGRIMANYWHGVFPHENLLTDGFLFTSPVGAFPTNNFGLFDMIGNVWEWTSDWYSNRHQANSTPCCALQNSQGGGEASSRDCSADIPIGRKVLKGGSHLCAPNHCQRYRPAARYPQPIDTSTSHVGFRCVASG